MTQYEYGTPPRLFLTARGPQVGPANLTPNV